MSLSFTGLWPYSATQPEQGPPRTAPIDNIDSLLFRVCTQKCIETSNMNIKGDAINHTIYECYEHCGSKF